MRPRQRPGNRLLSSPTDTTREPYDASLSIRAFAEQRALYTRVASVVQQGGDSLASRLDHTPSGSQATAGVTDQFNRVIYQVVTNQGSREHC